MTLLPVSLQVGGRPHIRAPDTVEKITSRDRRDSRHTHALTLEPLHDIDCKGLMDDIRRSSMLTPRSSMDSGILLQDFLDSSYFISCFFTTRQHLPNSGGSFLYTVPCTGSRGMFFCATSCFSNERKIFGRNSHCEFSLTVCL